MPKALQEAKGVWSVQRFIEAMQNGIEKAGLNQVRKKWRVKTWVVQILSESL
jgi:hypothetical protein